MLRKFTNLLTPDFSYQSSNTAPQNLVCPFSSDSTAMRQEHRVMANQAPYPRIHRSQSANDVSVISKQEFDSYRRRHESIADRLGAKNRRLLATEKKHKEQIVNLQQSLERAGNETEQAYMDQVDIALELQNCRDHLQYLQRTEQEHRQAKIELAGVREELRNARNEIADLHYLNEELQALQNEFHKLLQEPQTCNHAQEETQTSEAEVQSLRARLATSENELSACKDDLFGLQPAAQVPDSDIVKDFDAVAQMIISWIDSEISLFEDDNPRCNVKKFFSVGDDNIARQILKIQPDLGEHFARFVIHRFLFRHLFGDAVPLLGLTKAETALLQRAETSMGSLDPPRSKRLIQDVLIK